MCFLFRVWRELHIFYSETERVRERARSCVHGGKIYAYVRVYVFYVFVADAGRAAAAGLAAATRCV